jgi:hypothetical protein
MASSTSDFQDLCANFNKRLEKMFIREGHIILSKKQIKKMYKTIPYYNGNIITDEDIDSLYKYYESKMATLAENLYNKLGFLESIDTQGVLKECVKTMDELKTIGVTGSSFLEDTVKAFKYKMIDRCFVCNNHTKNVCSKCMKTKYCSKECQKSDWKNHKPKCKKRL